MKRVTVVVRFITYIARQYCNPIGREVTTIIEERDVLQKVIYELTCQRLPSGS